MRKSTYTWRFAIYKQDNYVCVVCGEDDIQHLEAHHILPQRTHPELANELWNGITLCQFCHCQTWTKELEMAPYFFALQKNGANSVKTLPSNVEGNPELNIEGDLYKCVTTRRRILKRLRKFFRKKIPCTECGKDVLMHYFRIKNIKHHFCSKECLINWRKVYYKGSNNPNYKEARIIKCLFCNKETRTPSDKNRVKKYCNNSCQLRYEHQNGLKVNKPYLNGKWTKKYIACLKCNKTDSKHSSKGICNRCYLQDSNSPTKALVKDSTLI